MTSTRLDSDRWPQMFEDRLAHALRETGEELAPRDLTRLVNGGVADGRRRRRRHTAAVVGGSAALALVAVGGALVPSLLDAPGSRSAAGPAAQPDLALSGSATPVSDADKAARLLKALEGVLPAGTVSRTQASWDSKVPGGKNVVVDASLLFDDGKGPASISVALTRYPVNVRQLPSCAPNPALVPNDVCHTYRTPGGGRLVVDLGYEYPSKGYGTKAWSAWLDLPDGSHLEVTEYNSAAEKDSPVTRATPPLTGDQLKAAALNSVWTPLLQLIPAPTGHPAGSPSAQPGPR